MSIFNFWRKPKREARVRGVNLCKLENHFILHVGLQRCDFCKMETNNCCKLDIDGQCICICPRKDIKAFRKPKTEKK